MRCQVYIVVHVYRVHASSKLMCTIHIRPHKHTRTQAHIGTSLSAFERTRTVHTTNTQRHNHSHYILYLYVLCIYYIYTDTTFAFTLRFIASCKFSHRCAVHCNNRIHMYVYHTIKCPQAHAVATTHRTMHIMLCCICYMYISYSTHYTSDKF